MTETLSQLEKERVQVVRDIPWGWEIFAAARLPASSGAAGKPNAGAISPGIPATDQIFVSPMRFEIKRSRRRFPVAPPCTKRSGRWMSFTSFEALRRDPGGGQRKDLPVAPRGRGRNRDERSGKNGGSDPSGDREEVDRFYGWFPGSAQARTPRPGSDGDGGASALHRAGAAALTQLLQFPAPRDEPRTVPCPCGQPAPCHQLRAKPVLTAVGPVENLSSLLRLPELPRRPVPSRCRTGHRTYGVLSRGATHAGHE